MQIFKLACLMGAIAGLAGCEGQSQTERALAGGLTAGLIASGTQNNVAQSAAAGALAGMATCGIQGMPPCR